MSLSFNERVVFRPPINTRLQKSPNIDITALRSILEKGLATLSASSFDEVGALTSRLIARRAASFRAQYGFKLLRKTNIALCRLQEINIVHAIEEFQGTIPVYHQPGTKVELPTRDNFDYLLVRLQSLAALLFRVVKCARESSTLFLFYISRNFFLETSIILVGVLAEIWTNARRLCEHTVHIYNDLQAFGEGFGQRKNYLAAAVQLPTKLDEFLGAEWTEECKNKTDSNYGRSSDAHWGLMHDFDNNADKDFIVDLPADEVIAKKKMTPGKHAKKDEQTKKHTAKVQIRRVEVAKPVEATEIVAASDIGIAIERHSRTPTMSLDRVINADDIQTFVKAEKQRMLHGGDDRAAERISMDKWKDLQRRVNQILVTSQGKNTVNMFKKFWSMTVLNKQKT